MLYLRYIHLALLTLLLLPSLAAANVIITEVLADPPGDANRDGLCDPHEDEFIELYNTGSRRISLAGWRLGDAGSLSNYFRFPPGAVIEPGSYVVLFGGGNPSGFTIPVYTDDGTIGDGLTDTGESIHLINKHGDEVTSLFQSTWPDDQSLVCTSPDSSAFVPHKTVSHNKAPFSPGHAPGTQHSLTYSLIISEVLADPPPGLAGDANRDGQRDPYEDEFIEIYNAGPIPISLAGWRLGDAGSLRGYFRFPPDAVIAPGSYVVLFGGGNPSEFTIPVYTDDGTIGDGLTDSGESIHLIDDHGHEISFLSQSTWPNAQSLVCTSADDEAFVPHKTASQNKAPFSPGYAPEPPTEPAPPVPRPTYALFISEVLADPPGDANRDGRHDPYEVRIHRTLQRRPRHHLPGQLAVGRLGLPKRLLPLPARCLHCPSLVHRPLWRRQSIGIHRSRLYRRRVYLQRINQQRRGHLPNRQNLLHSRPRLARHVARRPVYRPHPTQRRRVCPAQNGLADRDPLLTRTSRRNPTRISVRNT